MPLLTSLLLLIVFARLLGQLLVRFGQPAIAGEMLAGVMLGPACLKLISPNPALSGISELAVFLVVLSAGLEMNFKEVIGAFRGRGLFISISSFVIPLAAGLGTGILFHLDVMRTVFLGLSVSITALPVAVRILGSFKLLNSSIARYSIASAILNDVAALLALGVILNLPNERSFEIVAESIFWTGGKLAILAVAILGFNRLIHWIERRGIHIEKIPERIIDAFGNEALLGIVIAFVLVFSSLSETLGFHFVVGAFFGALLIDKEFFLASRYKELERTLASVTNGFLAPVFFAYLGLEFNLSEMKNAPFVLTVLIVSILSKILSGWMGGKLAGLTRTESLGIGIILNGRGVMGLVIASIAYERKFIGQGLFSTLVLMSIATTILAPVLFRKWVLPKIESSASLESIPL